MKKILLVLIILGHYSLLAQNYTEGTQAALDFLTIPVDARSAALGNAGIATSTDSYSHQTNAAKYVFGAQTAGVHLSYVPWLRNLVKDMYIAHVGGFFKIDTIQSLSGSLRYFALGEMDMYDVDASPLQRKSPFQLAVDIAYGRKLAKKFSMSVAFRYFVSDLYSGVVSYKKGQAIAIDLHAYFKQSTQLFQLPGNLSIGAGLSNLGTKLTYSENGSYFMPMQIKVGAAYQLLLNPENSLQVSTDIARSLVPRSHKYLDDAPLAGLFNSFSDGSNSFLLSFGAEYAFRETLFARSGFFSEAGLQGNRQHLSFGLGLRYNKMLLDCAYIASTSARTNPLSNSIRFSLGLTIN